MRSLEERIAQRAKQKANERKERDGDPNNQTLTDNDERSEGGGSKFDTSKYLGGNVNAINGGLKDLSDADLNAVEKAEGGGKKRAGVLDAIATEKKRRAAASSGWNQNAG